MRNSCPPWASASSPTLAAFSQESPQPGRFLTLPWSHSRDRGCLSSEPETHLYPSHRAFPSCLSPLTPSQLLWDSQHRAVAIMWGWRDAKHTPQPLSTPACLHSPALGRTCQRERALTAQPRQHARVKETCSSHSPNTQGQMCKHLYNRPRKEFKASAPQAVPCFRSPLAYKALHSGSPEHSPPHPKTPCEGTPAHADSAHFKHQHSSRCCSHVTKRFPPTLKTLIFSRVAWTQVSGRRATRSCSEDAKQETPSRPNPA